MISRGLVKNLRRPAHHGRLSSATTGKSAALRFPLEFMLSELKMTDSFNAVESTSISSSKSDIVASVNLMPQEIVLAGKF